MWSRYGITLDENSTAAEKFNEIVKRGLDNFALATAEAQTGTGRLKQMANAWGDLKESVGSGLAEAFADLAQDIGLSANNLSDFNAKLGETNKLATETATKNFFTGLGATGGYAKNIFGMLATVNPIAQASEIYHGRKLFSSFEHFRTGFGNVTEETRNKIVANDVPAAEAEYISWQAAQERRRRMLAQIGSQRN